MNEQLDLLTLPAHPLAHQRGSRTSKAAADQAVRFADSQRARVRSWLIEQGERGGTQIEASAALDIGRASACPRFRELERMGAIYKLEVRGGAHVYRARKAD